MELKVTRAADRKIMAKTVYGILAKVAAPYILLFAHPDECGEREVGVSFEHATGLRVNVSFDGDDSQDREGCFCMAWNSSYRRSAPISDKFGIAMQASVNPHHFSKCTAFADGFQDLCDKLEIAVAMMNDGTAFRA